MLKYFFVSLLTILVSFETSSAQKYSFSPDLYNSASIPDSLKENANSVVRYYNKEIIVKSAGKAVVKEHIIKTILNDKDEKEGSFVLFYDKKFSEISSAEMRVYDKNGILIKKYKKGDFYDRSAVDGFSIITDSRLMATRHAIANYPITIEKVHETILNSFLDLSDWHIQEEDVAIQQAKCKVSVNPEVGFRYQLRNFKQLPVKGTEEDYETFTWEVKALKAIKPEQESKSWSFLPRISFATNAINFDGYPGDMSTWKGFGLWAQSLNQKGSELPAKRVEEIKQLVSGLSTDKEKAKFLYEYLQRNTRYVSIQLGIGGLKPFPATFVDEKKYGDCKALSNYMHALLKSVGIPSYYSLVRAGKNEEPADPGFVNDPFNHVILCIPFKNDTTWLECTSNTHEFGKLGPFTENRNALLITEEGGVLKNTPKSISKDHVFDSELNVKIEDDGSAKVKILLKSTGSYRDMFINISELKIDEQKQFFIEYLNLKQPDLFELAHKLDKDGMKHIEINLEYLKLSDMASGAKYFYRPGILNLWKSTLPSSTSRKTDYFFDHPMQKKSLTIFEIPAGLEVESLPADVSCRFSFGNYAVKYIYNKEKNQIRSEAQFELSNHVIPALKYSEMQKYMDEVSKSMSKKIVLKKKV